MKKTLRLSLFLVALLSQADADESIKLIPLEVTSTAIATNELQASCAVEVYTSEDIQKAHVQNVYEFLNTQTSVISMPSFGNPFSQKLDMRGYGISDGYQNIVVTLNGRKINNIDMVAPLLNSIAVSSIEKIEIIKSSGIVSSGDGANAGVVNIVTKQNSDKEFTLYGGTYGAWDSSFYLGHHDEKLSVSVNGEGQKSAGVRTIDTKDGKDENSLSTATFTLAYTPIEEVELRTNASFARTDVIYASYLTLKEYESNPKQAGATNWGANHQKYDSDSVGAGVSYFIDEVFSLSVDANHEKKKSNFLTYDSLADYNYNSAKASLDYKGEQMRLSTGLDMFSGERNSHAATWSSANETKKENLAGFVLGDVSFSKNTLQAGVRIEKVSYKFHDVSKTNSDASTLHGAELGYNYMLDDKNSLFANYANAYQAPDIDRFFSYGVFNDFISPMKTQSMTLGYNAITPVNKFKISAYYVALEDEIYYFADPTFMNSKNTNIDKSHKYGVDLYEKYIISGMWNILLNYNLTQAIIDEERENGENYADKNLPGVSNHNAKMTLSYLPTPHATIALTQNYRSEAYAANDFNNNFSQKQDAYKTTDISLTYAKENYELFAKINNLFNQSNGMWIEDDVIYPLNFTTTAIAGLKLKY